MKPATQMIPIGLIDEPDLAMRETISDEGLESLARSMRDHGQLQEIGVVRNGMRYRIAYGHRRALAAPRAGFTELRAFVFPEGTTTEEAMKVAENTEREAVNPAAEATYFRHLLDGQCEGDVRRVSAIVGKPERYVQDRLVLTEGDPDVLEALRREDIGLGMAQTLNKVKDDGWRRQWLHDAATMGLSVKYVETMRRNLERDQAKAQAQERGEFAAVPPSTISPASEVDRCVLCLSTRDQHRMAWVKVHDDCRSAMERTRDEGPQPGGPVG